MDDCLRVTSSDILIMNTSELLACALREMSVLQTDDLIKSIGIPARPVTLIKLQKEIKADDPDLRCIAVLVASDLTLTVAVLRTVNSSAFGLSRRCETIEQAVAMMGLKRLNVIVTGLVLRGVLKGDTERLNRFWDVSDKRSHAMSRLAVGLKGVDVDMAHSFGLFCDVGIPLLMQRFADYGQTLSACNHEPSESFTQIEHKRHHTDHALVGAIMARTWDISQTLCLAIRLHHDYSVFQDTNVPDVVARLIAMGLIAEVAIHRFSHHISSTEWEKGGDYAAGALVLSDHDVEDWIDRLIHDFAKGTI